MIPVKSFDARSVGGLAIWLDAFLPPSETTWADKSGNGRNGRQDSVNNRPAWVASGINGRPALLFDGINDNFSLPALSLPNWHVFAACVPTGNKTIVYASTAGAIPQVLSSSSSGIIVASGAASGTASPSWVDTRVGASWDGGAMRSFLNGYLGELLVFSSTLAAPQAAAVSGYLARKWGL